MINKANTFTVAELLKMLADGRVTPDMPITIFCDPNRMVGCSSTEIVTYKDGSKSLTFYPGKSCARVEDINTTAEVFP